LLCFSAAPAAAGIISFSPTNQPVQLGDPVSVEVLFQNPEDTFVSAFDFIVTYNTDFLTFKISDVSFGPHLGGGVLSFQDVSDTPKGGINLSELSLVQNLSTIQDGASDLLLCTITFEAYSLGVSDLGFSGDLELIDGNGDPIVLDHISAGSIEVVPIPSSVVLLSIGLASLLGIRGKTRRLKGDL
jgi:hypothetical protein